MTETHYYGDKLSIFNLAPSDVIMTLDGCTCPRKKMVRSCQSKWYKLCTGPVLPPASWWSSIATKSSRFCWAELQISTRQNFFWTRLFFKVGFSTDRNLLPWFLFSNSISFENRVWVAGEFKKVMICGDWQKRNHSNRFWNFRIGLKHRDFLYERFMIIKKFQVCHWSHWLF